MSVRYQLISAFVKRMGMKQLFSLPAGELLEKARKMNRGRRFRLPKDHKAFYGDRLILDHYHCLTIQRKRECAPKAILMTVAPGMCHCYAMVPWFPEGRAAYLEIVERLR